MVQPLIIIIMRVDTRVKTSGIRILAMPAILGSMILDKILNLPHPQDFYLLNGAILVPTPKELL